MTDKTDKFVGYPELETVFGIRYSRMQLWRLERDGKFPKRIALSKARVAWLYSEISDWIKTRTAERDKEVKNREQLHKWYESKIEQTTPDPWEQVALLAQHRLDLVPEIEQTARALADKYNELVRLGEEMCALSPAELKHHWNPLRADFVLEFFKIGLFKITGWKWIARYPWPAERAPALISKIAEGNEWLLKKKRPFRRK